MKRITFALAAALILAAFAISLPKLKSDVQAHSVTTPAAVSFGDACKNVKFRFKNSHYAGGQIMFQRIKYFNKANGNWQTEDINNVVCNQESTCTSNGQDLRDSEGEALTKFQLIFKYKGPGTAANWSGEVSSPVFTPVNSICNANRIYSGDPTWTIN